MSGLYASDGSINVTTVPGTSYTGLYAADGSWNVVVSNGASYVGAYHPCGALWVSLAPSSSFPTPFRAPDGSMYVSVAPYTNGGQKVTSVSGTLGYTPTYYIYGF